VADTTTARENARLLAARLRDNPDEIDPAAAAEAGIDLLHELDADTDTDTETLRIVTALVGFALHVTPDHPSVPEWWGELGHAHGWIAEETDSVAEYGTAIACSLTAVSAPQAPPEVAEQAAVDAAHLTSSLLRLENVTAERARQLITALDGISLSWTDALDATLFELGLAWALRFSYPLTQDSTDLERAADILRRALAAPVLAETGHDCVDEWELLAIVLEQLYVDSDDLGLLEESLAAAMKVCELLPEGHEWLPEAHGVVASMADEIFWRGDGEASDVLDTAITSFAAKRAAIGLDDDETVSYALLIQVRGCDAENVPALTAAITVLQTPERAPGSEVVLASLHELLSHLEGPQHAWQTVDWATRALSRSDLGPEMVLPLHDCRVAGLAAAFEAFGGNEVAERCDVDAVLAGARIEAMAGEDAARAELGLHAAQFHAQWAADRFPLDIELFQTTSEELADALLRMRDYADEDRRPKLAAVATLLKDMVPVFLGDRDPGPFRAALQDESLTDVADVDGLLKWMEHRTALKAMADSNQPVGAQLQKMVTDVLSGVPESEHTTGEGAIAALMNAFAEMATVVENGDNAARSAAYAKAIRMCEELPENIASSPFARDIRGMIAAQMAIGGHDSDHTDSAIEDLERALARLDRRWSEDGLHLIERLGNLLRLRGGPGDTERSRQLGLRALVQQMWRVLTRPNLDHGTSTARFARLVTGWCLDDGAHDDLVRAVEAERGIALARGAGVELLHHHLVGTGRAALAEEWAAVPGTDDAWTTQHLDLAPRLSEEDKKALAEPLGPQEIRALLRDLGLDALVYLVPSHPTTGGVAVVVPVDGAVTSAQLPLLTGEWFTRNSTAEAAALDSIGGWAWLAGGAAVLAAGQAAEPERVPRIVLVPVGALGSVPWAAAWRETGTGRRHLVEDIEITIVPSARFLVHTSPADEEPVLLPSRQEGMPGPDYDEALEPSSTFLARGTRTVVRGVWPVADDSVLLSLFRRHLGEHPANPAAALRKAQLAMLRQALPDGVSANPADIANWGGFAYLGG
jgi:hypothetical protein